MLIEVVISKIKGPRGIIHENKVTIVNDTIVLV